MKLGLPFVALGLLVAGCASPSQRIERRLVEVGLPQTQARCMGDRLAARLSGSQLRQLDQLVRLNGDRIGRMRLEDIGRTLSDQRDPALVAEVVRSGISCLI